MSEKAKRSAARRAARAPMALLAARKPLAIRSGSPPVAVPPHDPSECRRDLTVRTVAVAPSTFDEATRSVEAVFTTEDPTDVFDMASWEIVREVLLMSGAEHDDQVPLLDSHNRWRVTDQLGSGRQMRVEGDKLVGRVHFSSVQEAADALTKVREGHLTDLSIGYRVFAPVMIAPGESATVKGRKFTAPANQAMRIATKWKVREVSLTPIGADARAKVRETPPHVTRETPTKEDQTMTFEKWLEERGFVLADLSDTQRASLDAVYRGEHPETPQPLKIVAAEPLKPAPVDTSRVVAEAIAAERAAERTRVQAIRAEAGTDVSAEVVEKLIAEGKSLDEARAAILEAVRKARPNVQGGAPAVHVADRQATGRRIVDGMLLRAGLESAILSDKANGERRAEEASRFRLNLMDVCRMALRMDGVEEPMGYDELVSRAFATASLPVLLGEVVNKSVLAGYNEAPVTWRSFCDIGSGSDFKTMTRVLLTGSRTLEVVNNAGEIPSGELQEESETIQLQTRGQMLSITRQNVRNDDLGQLTKIPMMFGRGAQATIAKQVYTKLLANAAMVDTVACFHATHRNLNTSSALTATTYGTAVKALQDQYDVLGEPIDVQPDVLLAPTGLRVAAETILNSIINVATGSTDLVQGNKNTWYGTSRAVIEPRLSNTNYSGYSATTWYLLAKGIMEVAFLDGKQTPTIEQATPASNVLGIGWRVYMDFSAELMDWRRGVKSTA